MTLNEAALAGITRLRLPMWADPEDYLKIDILRTPEGAVRGPWAHLYARQSQTAIEVPTPQPIMLLTDLSAEYEEYIGPRDIDDRAPEETP